MGVAAERTRFLQEGLADLARRLGPERLLDCEWVEPTDAFFPDRWTPDAAGVLAMARRLFDRAGLDRLELALRECESAAPPAVAFPFGGISETVRERRGPAVSFAALEGGRCTLLVETQQLDDPRVVVAGVARAAACALLADRGLSVVWLEDPLPDVASVYLGFGLLVANGAERVTTRGLYQGRTAYTHIIQATTSFLDGSEIAYLLAVAALARGLDPKGIRHMAGLLEGDAGDDFRRAAKALAPSRATIAASFARAP